MDFLPRPRPTTVNKHGVGAGSILCGVTANNQGLRLRVLQEQARGHDGPIRGGFIILDAGDNKHAGSLEPLLRRITNAEEVLGIIRERHPACVNVANANILAMEPG